MCSDAVWMASVGVRSLLTALNAAYEVPESRPIWLLIPLSILYTIGLAGMVALATGLMLIGPRVVQWLADHLGLSEIAVVLWTWLRWPAVLSHPKCSSVDPHAVSPSSGVTGPFSFRPRWMVRPIRGAPHAHTDV